MLVIVIVGIVIDRCIFSMIEKRLVSKRGLIN
jgi:hypothetical protein